HIETQQDLANGVLRGACVGRSVNRVVGDVATPSAGNQNLRAEPARAIERHNTRLWSSPPGPDRGEQARCPCSNDCHIDVLLHACPSSFRQWSESVGNRNTGRNSQDSPRRRWEPAQAAGRLDADAMGFMTTRRRKIVQYRTFGRTGWQVREIGYGMWGMGEWSGSDVLESMAALERAAELGCNFLDTAFAYGEGRSEK